MWMLEGILKLIDFGIARAIQSDATSIMCQKQMGTLNYMSPEAVNSNNAAVGGAKVLYIDMFGRLFDVCALPVIYSGAAACVIYRCSLCHSQVI